MATARKLIRDNVVVFALPSRARNLSGVHGEFAFSGRLPPPFLRPPQFPRPPLSRARETIEEIFQPRLLRPRPHCPSDVARPVSVDDIPTNIVIAQRFCRNHELETRLQSRYLG